MNTTTCFAPAHILLPAEQIPLEQWGCIACDQFTSDREYWQRAKEAADGSPSTLNLILPEVYLEDGDADARVEHTGFRAVQIIKRARGNIRFRQNLLRRCMLKSLLQKQTHTGRKNSLARGLLFVAVCHLYPSFPCFRIDSNTPK